MTIIQIEGNERVGKTTIAKLLEKQGFKYIHMGAPDKKYTKPGYGGPSFCEDLVEMYMSFASQNVVIDRTEFGELVYSKIYGRSAALTEEDIVIIKEITDTMDCKRILMIDPDENTHWQRCVDNKEPINYKQFKMVNQLFEEIADKHDFIKLSLSDIENGDTLHKIINGEKINNEDNNTRKPIVSTDSATTIQIKDNPTAKVDNGNIKHGNLDVGTSNTHDSLEQRKLAEANAIDEVIRGRIVKKKGEYFDILEEKVRKFLHNELTMLLGTNKPSNKELTNEEIDFLRILINKAKGGK